MKPAPIFLVTAAVAAATAFVVTQVHSTSSAGTQPAAAVGLAPGADEVARLARSVDALDKRLQKDIDDLRMELAKRSEPARIPIGDIDAAVARALGAERTARAVDEPASKPAAPAKKLVPRTVWEELTSGRLSREEAQALWKKASEDGILDEVLSMYEDRAKANPNDPRAQCELGKAYLQKLLTLADGPEKGKWATMADKQFEKTLAIDDHDWEARFQKSVSLSFWPSFLGKQNEAIAGFEILTKQQEGLPPQPGFAQSWIFLGNMYLTTGQKDKALAAWKSGLEHFPDNADLQKQIALAQGQ